MGEKSCFWREKVDFCVKNVILLANGHPEGGFQKRFPRVEIANLVGGDTRRVPPQSQSPPYRADPLREPKLSHTHMYSESKCHSGYPVRCSFWFNPHMWHIFTHCCDFLTHFTSFWRHVHAFLQLFHAFDIIRETCSRIVATFSRI